MKTERTRSTFEGINASPAVPFGRVTQNEKRFEGHESIILIEGDTGQVEPKFHASPSRPGLGQSPADGLPFLQSRCSPLDFKLTSVDLR